MAALPTPLTTTFTPAASCLSDIHWGTVSSWYVLGEYDSACLPPGPNPTLSSFYSPGLDCPSGYTVACSSTVASETHAYCCPVVTDLPYLSNAGMVCNTSPPAFGAWSSYGCSMGFGNAVSSGPVTIVVTDAGGTSTTTTSLTNVNEGLNAYSVQIRWQASDVQKALASSTATDTGIGTASGTSGGSGATTVTATTGSASPSQSVGGTDSNGSAQSGSGLSNGAKIAIAVVVPVVLITALVITLLFVKRRRGTRRIGYKETNSPPMEPIQAASNPLYEVEGARHRTDAEKTGIVIERQEMADTSFRR